MILEQLSINLFRVLFFKKNWSESQIWNMFRTILCEFLRLLGLLFVSRGIITYNICWKAIIPWVLNRLQCKAVEVSLNAYNITQSTLNPVITSNENVYNINCRLI